MNAYIIRLTENNILGRECAHLLSRRDANLAESRERPALRGKRVAERSETLAE